MKESDLQTMVADYLKTRYKGVKFHSDFGSGIKLTIGQAAKQKRQNSGRAWPDMFIAKPVGNWCGLFLELKRDGVKIIKKDGDFASRHIKEQAQVLEELEAAGYRAAFAVGFDEAVQIIDDYFGGRKRAQQFSKGGR